MKDYAVNKVKRIMDNRNVFVCRVCGMSHDNYRKAQACHQKRVKGKFNKNRSQFLMAYEKEVGVTFKAL